MKFLADENVEAPIVAGLRGAGHDVLYIIEVGGSPSDDKVIDLAYREQRILITNDKGFGEKVFHNKQPVTGVILLRFKKEDAILKSQVLLKAVQQFGHQLIGMFMIVTEGRVRMTRLR
jgi:predicted nuclease of predicted toxin-antitoxin system